MMGRIITCIACGGKGWLRATTMYGLPFPRKCAACSGTGKQTVKP